MDSTRQQYARLGSWGILFDVFPPFFSTIGPNSYSGKTTTNILPPSFAGNPNTTVDSEFEMATASEQMPRRPVHVHYPVSSASGFWWDVTKNWLARSLGDNFFPYSRKKRKLRTPVPYYTRPRLCRIQQPRRSL